MNVGGAPVAAARAGRLGEIVVDPRRRGVATVGERAYPALIAACAFVILFLRLPDALLHPELIYEDVLFAQGGGMPFGGYLNLVPWLVAHYPNPLFLDAFTMVCTAALCGFVAARFGVIYGLGLPLLPVANELSWHIRNLQWTFELALLAFVGVNANRFLVGLMSLTGPFSILWSPLYLWKRTNVTPVLLAGAAIQVAVLLVSHRTPGSVRSLADALSVIGTRAVVQPFVGFPAPLVIALPILALLVIACRAVPRPALLVGGAAVAISLAAAIIGATDPIDRLLNWWNGGRYFLVAGALLPAVAVRALLGVDRPARLAGAALVGLLALGVIRTFALPPL